ncbi:hypothetical protein DV736_g5109, partial [Chaetothyriales sp. CBS 134916]
MTPSPTAGWRKAASMCPGPGARRRGLPAALCTPTRSLSPAYRIPRRPICRPLSSAARPSPAQSSSASASSGLRNSVHKARTDYPILFPALLIGTAVSLSLLGLLAWDEYSRVAPAFSAYPPAVEQRLRLALHYTYISPDPDAASRYFREAIEVAEGSGMDPLGKEYLGLRIRYAECLENQTGQVPSREDLLKRIIQNKVKLASLYDTEYMQDRASAKRLMSAAIQLLVSETPDAASKGFSDKNAAGLSLAEIAAMLSQMGDLYATSGEEAKAVQTYMLALPTLRAACNGSRSCKEVQLLSNVAATMDQALKKPNAKINGKPATPDLVHTARNAILKWADQAIATVERVNPEDRDHICDLALLSAQMTKADLLLQSGDKAQSREILTSLLPTLHDKGLTTLSQVAEDALKRATATV